MSDEEHGTRVELRTIGRPAHIGTESAAQPVTLDRPLWRADIFDLIGEPKGNLARAHFHPRFDGREPSDRRWDPLLREDWAGWLTGQIRGVLGRSARRRPRVRPGAAAAAMPLVPSRRSRLGRGHSLGRHPRPVLAKSRLLNSSWVR